MNRAVIAIGSNIRTEKSISDAKERIRREMTVVSESEFVKTEPIGFEDQPDFVNGVLLVDTDFGLEALEKWLHGLENALGRVRTQNRYRPRPIDLDVVVWNGKILDSDVFDREYLRRAVLQVLPDLNILI